MTDHLFMCLIYREYHFTPISFPRFFLNIYYARVYAIKHAKIHVLPEYVYTNHCKIYRIQCDEDFDIDSVYFNHHEHYENPQYISLVKIQIRYKLYFIRKIQAVIKIQRALKEAITNPRTRLCQKRLLREFNGM
jgi:hypothetical protein